MDSDEILARLIKETNEALEPYLRKNLENFHRIGRLVGVFQESQCDDVLRSAVVFLHATLEDTLRTIASDFLPTANETVLNQVPLKGSNGTRAEKFSLGKLAAHRKMTVGDLIKASVEDHLQRETFNNAEDIVNLLQSLDFDIAPLRPFLGSLEAIMKRRHQIVHRADRGPSNELTEIDAATVWEWTNTAVKFIAHVSTQVNAKHAIVSVKGVLVDIARAKGFDPDECGLG